MTEEQPKSGKEFEALVTWIHQCLHEKAVITPNDKIRDVHSKRLRQIDISIRLKDGPTSFLGIVEVRDRSRPIGENYVEEISAKRESVGADAAFLVSASGFCDTAIEKAKALNIRVFTYQDALSSDRWMQCLQLSEITQFIEQRDNVVVTFLEPTTNKIIDPHQSIVDAIRENVNAVVLVNEKGEPKFSIPNIADMVINQNRENLFSDVRNGDRKRKRAFVVLQTPPSETETHFRDSTGSLRKLEKFCLDADYWVEVSKTPVHRAKFVNAGSGEALAEIASTTIEAWGSDHELQMIAKFSGEQGSQVLMRLQKKDSSQSK